MNDFQTLLRDIKNCTLCAAHLPFPPNPILQFSSEAKILIAGQAPGQKAHASGIPFNDPSGDRLREWMGITKEVFYDARQIAILPMGFCFPGTSKKGDLPPRPECAAAWRSALLAHLPKLQLTLVIGHYAHAYHFPEKAMPVTERVQAWQNSVPQVIPLPHPSPRNMSWFKRNPWFNADLLPVLRHHVSRILAAE